MREHVGDLPPETAIQAADIAGIGVGTGASTDAEVVDLRRQNQLFQRCSNGAPLGHAQIGEPPSSSALDRLAGWPDGRLGRVTRTAAPGTR